MQAMGRTAYTSEKYLGTFLKSLFLILVLALSFFPVFQAAHALTHVDLIHEAHSGDEIAFVPTVSP
jgi:molybdopterin converting factor small subunit